MRETSSSPWAYKGLQMQAAFHAPLGELSSAAVGGRYDLHTNGIGARIRPGALSSAPQSPGQCWLFSEFWVYSRQRSEARR